MNFSIARTRSVTTTLLGAVIVVMILLSSTVPALAQVVQHVQLAGGGREDIGHSIAVDAAGNRYIAGSFEGRATFGTGVGAVALTSQGGVDGFVAKYDAEGGLVWVRQMGGSLTDQARGVAVASDGAVHVTGHFALRASFSGSTVGLVSQGATDIFVVRYDRDGGLSWAVRAGGANGDNGLGIAVDADGNAVVTGNIAATASFSGVGVPVAASLQSAGGIDIFLARYSPTGRLEWAQRAGGSGNDSGRGLAIAPDGEIFLTGSFSTVSSFGGGAGANITLTSAGLDDAVVARYSPAGELRWAQRAGGQRADRGLAIALDASQNSYITGFFTEATEVGTTSLVGLGVEVLLAKLNPSGAFVQAISAGGAGADEGRGITVTPGGTVYLAGIFFDLALFGEGAQQRELRQIDRFSQPGKSAFIAAYRTDLALTFVEAAGGAADEREQSGNAIAADNQERAHMTGVTRKIPLFGVGTGITIPSPIDQGDIFLATYAANAPREVFYLSSSSGGSVDGIAFADEDVLAFDPANNRWSMLLDGSDIGLVGTDIDAFEWRTAESLFLSFESPITLPGIAGEVDDSDIVRFIPQQLGATTSGRFELFFDGSDVGLGIDAADIDAIGFRPNGQLIISTLGTVRLSSPSGAFNAGHEDLLAFNGDFGEETSGSLATLHDGFVNGLGDTPGEGLANVWMLPGGEDFAFGAGGPFTMDVVRLRADGADVFVCNLFESSGVRRCGASIFLDSSSKGFRGEIIDAFSVGESGVLGEIGDGDDTEAGPPEDPIEVAPASHQVFLPLLAQ